MIATVLAASEASENFVELDVPAWEWVALLAFLAVLLLVDILVIHREAHVSSLKRAAVESTVWISIGLGFGLVLWAGYGSAAAGEYYAGFLIEKSLSVDNVFVWALLFTYFAVPAIYQHRVLFWGIFGALVLRAVFIFAGVALIERFEWVLFVFGAFLVFTGLRLLRSGEAEVHPEHNPILRLVKRVVPSTDEYHGQHMFIKEAGKRLATPLFAVLIMIETTDVIFAVDSIPAILAVSHEQYIVFASNAFAILGLRALYFLLAGAHAKFTYLQPGLAIILGFVGIKMILSHWYHVPTGISLGIIALILIVSIGASLLRPPTDEDDGWPGDEHGGSSDVPRRTAPEH